MLGLVTPYPSFFELSVKIFTTNHSGAYVHGEGYRGEVRVSWESSVGLCFEK